MPSYEYKCTNCAHEFEVFQKASDPAPTECPKCHETGLLERYFSSAPGIDFKGKWFINNGSY